MEQLKLFLERANQDNELAEKLAKLGESDGIIALAAEQGFTVTAKDIEEFKKSEGGSTSRGELSEEELDKVAGGSSANRYCPSWCKGLTEARKACWFPFVWCDHYREIKCDEDPYDVYYDVSCAMNAFPPYVLKKKKWMED